MLEFAVGMGPKIIGWRKNDIDYSIRAFPIGGFCSFAGESPDDEESDPRNINLQPAWKRLIMTAAGPFMNFVLALVLAVVLMAAVGEYVMVNRIDTVTDGSHAAPAGLLPGDRITAVNGERSDEATEISAAIAQTGDSDVTLTIERGGSTFDAVVAKQYDAAPPYIKNRRLDAWTHNKAIQKAIESRRVTDGHKAELRTLKIK